MISTSHKRTNTVGFYSYEVPNLVKFIETESRTVAVRAWGRESRELLLNGYGVSALQHDKDSRDCL